MSCCECEKTAAKSPVLVAVSRCGEMGRKRRRDLMLGYRYFDAIIHTSGPVGHVQGIHEDDCVVWERL